MNKPLLVALLLLVSASPAYACIWDRDTLAMERAKFPEVNELIVGYFPRHSSAYYQWRMEQVLAIPVDDRKPADYDDLGASYDKLGQHEDAIATMLAKLERFPEEGLYETHANLGTFYIHNGELEKGVEYIGSAIEINPDAHFGREVYQKLLVEYVIQQRAKGNTLPLEPYANMEGFSEYVVKHLPEDENPFDGDDAAEFKDDEINRAIKGIQGMMRFGNYDSPVLLEVLGDLLSRRFMNGQGVQRLACRAYLKASLEVEDKDAVEAYREKARIALRAQTGASLEDIEAELLKEIAAGDSYFATIESDERAWIASGEDVDAKFNAKYYGSEPEFKNSWIKSVLERLSNMSLEGKFILLLFAVFTSYLVIGLVRLRRKRRDQMDDSAVTST